MNNNLTANELKTKGISAIEKNARQGIETVVTVHGKEKYVIVSMEQWIHFREYELSNALAETEDDLKKGKFKKGTVEDHIKRITNA